MELPGSVLHLMIMNLKQQEFSIKKRLKSFAYAWNGLKVLVKEEHNFRIHIVVTIGVVIFAILLKISVYEWIAIVLAIGLVMAMEIINSAIENMADFVSPEKHEMVKKIKDISAAGVLICAVVTFLVGLIIFLPKII